MSERKLRHRDREGIRTLSVRTQLGLIGFASKIQSAQQTQQTFSTLTPHVIFFIDFDAYY